MTGSHTAAELARKVGISSVDLARLVAEAPKAPGPNRATRRALIRKVKR